MLEYSEKVASVANVVHPSDRSANMERAMPTYMSLAAQYGLSDDMEIGGSDERQQTTEQEYQAYITAQPSPRNIDVLKFWEVGGT